MSLEQPRPIDYLPLHRLLRKEVVRPGQASIGYVMAETMDNQKASLLQAAHLLEQGVIQIIAVSNPKKPYDYCGYPGPEYCIDQLVEAGVSRDKILKISSPVHSQQINTQTELAMLAENLKNEGNNDGEGIVLIAPWFHILRPYITALSEFKKVGLTTKVYVYSVPLEPYEKITHSQGVQKGSRRGIWYEEIRKCIKYANLIKLDEASEIFHHQRPHLSG